MGKKQTQQYRMGLSVSSAGHSLRLPVLSPDTKKVVESTGRSSSGKKFNYELHAQLVRTGQFKAVTSDRFTAIIKKYKSSVA